MRTWGDIVEVRFLADQGLWHIHIQGKSTRLKGQSVLENEAWFYYDPKAFQFKDQDMRLIEPKPLQNALVLTYAFSREDRFKPNLWKKLVGYTRFKDPSFVDQLPEPLQESLLQVPSVLKAYKSLRKKDRTVWDFILEDY